MMSSSGEYYVKRRRMSDGVFPLPFMAVAAGDSLAQELKDIKVVMNQLLAHSHLQTTSMVSMEHNMGTMVDKLNYLTARNSQLETSMQQTQTSLQATGNKMDNANINLMQRLDLLENRQKYKEALVKNQKWTYSALIPYDSYWDSIQEEELEAASEFLEQIEKNTRDMRCGEGDESEDGKVSIRAELPFNTMFLPHWEEFASAVEQYQHALNCLPQEKKSSFHLYDVELPGTVLGLLSKALQSTHFHSFILDNNSFGRAGIKFALKYVESNPILEDFCLVQNPINHTDDINQLCEIVKAHPSIQMLGLSGCRGAEINGYDMLQSVMTLGLNKLMLIDLSSNDISTGGSTFISDLLARNPILQCLNLCHNYLDDEDGIMIASALKLNTILRTLKLEGNPIGRAGWAALRKAEFDDTSLNSASDSNHTCSIDYPSVDRLKEFGGDWLDVTEMNGDPYSEGQFDPGAVRQKKIYSVLSSRNRTCSNAHYLDDFPLQLLPDMLHSIQQLSEYHLHGIPSESRASQHCNDVKSFSVVYEIMRRWDTSFSVYNMNL